MARRSEVRQERAGRHGTVLDKARHGKTKQGGQSKMRRVKAMTEQWKAR